MSNFFGFGHYFGLLLHQKNTLLAIKKDFFSKSWKWEFPSRWKIAWIRLKNSFNQNHSESKNLRTHDMPAFTEKVNLYTLNQVIWPNNHINFAYDSVELRDERDINQKFCVQFHYKISNNSHVTPCVRLFTIITD